MAKDKKPNNTLSNVPNSYVKRKRKKAIAWTVLGICLVGSCSLGIISFLGRYSGHFTVQLDNTENAALTMDQDNNFTEGGGGATTYLRAEGMQNAYTFAADNLPEASTIDSSDGGNKNGTRPNPNGSSGEMFDTYFAYTFFIKNTSKSLISYVVSLSVDENIASSNDAVNLIDILRVRLYENTVTGVTETHSQETYAYPSATPYYLEDGSIEARECISNYNKTYSDASKKTISGKDPSPNTREENRGFATEFVSRSIAFSNKRNIESNAVTRYTAVLWLEGWDPDCKGQEPTNSSITFSMHFDASGNEKGNATSSSSSSN